MSPGRSRSPARELSPTRDHRTVSEVRKTYNSAKQILVDVYAVKLIHSTVIASGSNQSSKG